MDEDVVRTKVGDDCYSIFVGKAGIGVDRHTTFVKLNEFADAIRKAIADARIDALDGAIMRLDLIVGCDLRERMKVELVNLKEE